MKQLRNYRPGQEIWRHAGRTFSIVDLTVCPDSAPRSFKKAFGEMMRASYGRYHIELAEFRFGGDIEVLGRFSTFGYARKAVREHPVDWMFWLSLLLILISFIFFCWVSVIVGYDIAQGRWGWLVLAVFSLLLNGWNIVRGVGFL